MRRSCICLCVKNEGPYLLEWIAHHRLAGFDEIVIFNNGSDDGSEALLKPLAQAGEILLRALPDDPDRGPQYVAYERERERKGAEWLMFADADEFFVTRSGESINAFLDSFDGDVSQIWFNWRIFGSGGAAHRTAGLVTERFRRASLPGHRAEGGNAHVKAITRRSAMAAINIHAPEIRHGRAIHDDGGPVAFEYRGVSERISHQRAWVNHYVVKSREECAQKLARGRGTLPNGKLKFRLEGFDSFWARHDLNDVRDDTLYERRGRLRAEIERLTGIINRRSLGRRLNTAWRALLGASPD
jgi:hypothetical protein